MNTQERQICDRTTDVFTRRATVKTTQLYVCEGDTECVCPLRWSPSRRHFVHACQHGAYYHDHPAIGGTEL